MALKVDFIQKLYIHKSTKESGHNILHKILVFFCVYAENCLFFSKKIYINMLLMQKLSDSSVQNIRNYLIKDCYHGIYLRRNKTAI